jgi:hypothetical protein
MFDSRNNPPPKTTTVCQMLLEQVLNFGNSDLTSKQELALNALKKLCERGCTKALIHIVDEFGKSSLLFKQRLAKMASECIRPRAR